MQFLVAADTVCNSQALDDSTYEGVDNHDSPLTSLNKGLDLTASYMWPGFCRAYDAR
jgi:hypothetical protein